MCIVCVEYEIQHPSAPKNRTINEMIEEVIMFKRSQQVDSISKDKNMSTNRLVAKNMARSTVYHDMEIEVEYLRGLLYLGILPVPLPPPHSEYLYINLKGFIYNTEI